MKQDQENNGLFTEFPEISTSEWEAKLIADLKGRDYEKQLVWKTSEGFDVKPFYRKEDVLQSDFTSIMPDLIKAGYPDNEWLIVHDIHLSEPETVIARVKKAVDGTRYRW